MGSQKEFADKLKAFLELHPMGSVFCATSKESGHALNCPDLILYIEANNKLYNSLKEISKETDMGGYELEMGARKASIAIVEYEGYDD